MQHCNNHCKNEICVSGSDTKYAIDVSNNKSRYYAELAEQYKNETKNLRDSAKYYAEQNSNVTMSYIDSLEVTLRNLISAKQDSGNYALVNDIPVKLSDLADDINVITSLQIASASELGIVKPDLSTINVDENGVISANFSAINTQLQRAVKDNFITNCLLEVAQDINLELSNGTLTLKAGSKVYVPNGFESDGTTPKFDEVTIESDKTFSTTSNGTHFLTLNGQGNLAYNSVSLATSGTTQPSSAGYWYNTTDNIIRYNNGTAVSGQYSLPIAIFTVANNVISSIVQVFNGFGFIGASTFALPGVKMLGANGRNSDGTLNNYNRNYTSVKVRHESNTQSGNLISLNSGLGRFAPNAWLEGLKKDMPATVSNTGRWEYYATDENLVYTTSGSTTANWTQVNYFLLGTIEGDGTRFTGMTVKQALRLIDYNSLQDVDCVVETYQNGSSWYRIWSDGWCEQGGQTNSYSTNPQTITLLKNYSNTSYSVHCTQNGSNARAYTMGVTSKTTSSFQVYSGSATNSGVSTAADNSSTCWYTCGYIGV